MIKLVAMDMDGTLLNSAKSLPYENKKIIEKYAKAGIEFAFCTGRVMSELKEIAEQMPAVRYAITCNGAYVRDLHENCEVYADTIGMDEVRNIYWKLKNRGTDHEFELMADGVVYAERSCIEHPEKYGTLYIKDLIKKTRVPVENMEEFLEKRTVPAGKVNVFYESGAVRDLAQRDFMDSGYDVVYSEPTNLEITKKGINKGVGLTMLARHLKLTLDEVMAIGDNYNDIEMLQTAGHSVAMENAPEDVKMHAKYVTYSNDNMGVAHAIRQWCEGEML